ncbi:hypothetical protein [Methylobacterium indicum]|uniref:hypothetical protein n=1 Tax=Methylobacterium indicum TaxID=1775910 RepID=UPI001A9330DF|nr:hypothetical protein [Methylobacterium indicum]
MPRKPIDFGLDAFDRAAVVEEAGAAIRLISPRGGRGGPLSASDGTPVAITVRGAASATYDAAQATARHRLELVSYLRDTPGFACEVDEAELRVLMAVMIGWAGIVVDGASIAFSPEAAAALYRRFSWIREQIGHAIADPRNFPQRA